MTQTQTPTPYEQREADFARVRALILQILNANPGLTHEETQKHFLLKFGFLPTIDNRLRELRKLGLVYSISVNDKLHWYIKGTQGIIYRESSSTQPL